MIITETFAIVTCTLIAYNVIGGGAAIVFIESIKCLCKNIKNNNIPKRRRIEINYV
jgi:hypothetical protein